MKSKFRRVKISDIDQTRIFDVAISDFRYGIELGLGRVCDTSEKNPGLYMNGYDSGSGQ